MGQVIPFRKRITGRTLVDAQMEINELRSMIYHRLPEDKLLTIPALQPDEVFARIILQSFDEGSDLYKLGVELMGKVYAMEELVQRRYYEISD